MESARRYVADNIEKGVICPCCDQRAHRRKVTMNEKLARMLIWLVLYFRENREWVHVPSVAPRWALTNNNVGRLKYWGLVKTAPTDEDKPTSGMYKPTQRGMDFADGRIKVSAHCRVFNDVVSYWSGDEVNIQEALGKKWSYAEEVGRPLNEW